MVDIFVITLMVSMVELGNIATITPGPGSVAFALMVVATMLAVRSFDPRLVWDSLGDPALQDSPLRHGAHGGFH